jgi:hypothetical protein
MRIVFILLKVFRREEKTGWTNLEIENLVIMEEVINFFKLLTTFPVFPVVGNRVLSGHRFPSPLFLKIIVEEPFSRMNISAEVPPELLNSYIKSFIDSGKDQVANSC